jgi:transcriptional regulator with XRE-family HTH domain
MNLYENIIGKQVREKRKQLRLSLEELQAKTGISLSYLAQIERGEKSNIGRDTIVSICKSLNMSPLLFFPELPYENFDKVFQKANQNLINEQQLEKLLDAIIEIKSE